MRAKDGGCLGDYLWSFICITYFVHHGLHWNGVVVQTGMLGLFLVVYEVR